MGNIDEFLCSQFQKNTEVALYINIYIFEHWEPRVEALAPRHKANTKSKYFINTENNCNELIPRAYLLTEKKNILGNKYDWGKGTEAHIDTNKTNFMGNHMDDGDHTPEEVGHVMHIEERKPGTEMREWKMG